MSEIRLNRLFLTSIHKKIILEKKKEDEVLEKFCKNDNILNVSCENQFTMLGEKRLKK